MGAFEFSGPSVFGRSQTWADMSISLERDNLLPSSVFKKSSKHPKEREIATAVLQMTLPWYASLPQVWAALHQGPEVGGALSDLLSTEKKSTYNITAPSALRNSNLGPHSTPGDSQ